MFSRPMVRYLILLCFAVSASQNALASCAPWLKHDLKQLHSGKPLDVCAVTAGKPLLLVNTASHCEDLRPRCWYLLPPSRVLGDDQRPKDPSQKTKSQNQNQGQRAKSKMEGKDISNMNKNDIKRIA